MKIIVSDGLKRALKAMAARLGEPSTWSGLAGLALMVGLSAPHFLAIAGGLSFVFGLMAVAMPETGPK